VTCLASMIRGLDWICCTVGEEVWPISEEDVTCLVSMIRGLEWICCTVGEEVWPICEEDVKCFEFIKCGVCLDCQRTVSF
jgi:hypothetical protein